MIGCSIVCSIVGPTRSWPRACFMVAVRRLLCCVAIMFFYTSRFVRVILAQGPC